MLSLQFTFFSLDDSVDAHRWEVYFSELEDCLNSRLSHLDSSDPIRRKVDSIQNAASFVSDSGAKESVRRFFGKFDNCKAEIAITLAKDTSLIPHNITLHIPISENNDVKQIETAVKVFQVGCAQLKPFYSYADDRNQVSGKRKATGMSVDLEVELVGVFWLTFFNAKYVYFFGNEKIQKLHKYQLNPKLFPTGRAFKFGDLPATDESVSLRFEAERVLGQECFVNPNLKHDKPLSQKVLSFEKIKGT